MVTVSERAWWLKGLAVGLKTRAGLDGEAIFTAVFHVLISADEEDEVERLFASNEIEEVLKQFKLLEVVDGE